MHLYFLSLKKYLADKQRNFLIGLAGLAALSIFMGCIFSANKVENQGVILIFSLVYLGIFGCIRTSMMFASMKSTSGRIATLLSPASAWDKFAARWTVSIPFTIIVLFGAFWLCEYVRFLSWPIFNAGESTELFNLSNVIDQTVPNSLIASVIAGFLSLQAFFCFGAIAWPKMSAIKTVLLLWVLSFFFGTVGGLVDYTLTGGSEALAMLLLRTFVVANIIITLVLWGLTYMRFRESEVVDRLF